MIGMHKNKQISQIIFHDQLVVENYGGPIYAT